MLDKGLIDLVLITKVFDQFARKVGAGCAKGLDPVDGHGVFYLFRKYMGDGWQR